MLSAALSYARRGWHVFPLYEPRAGQCTCPRGASCPSPGKHPRVSGGLKDATTDESVIIAWWQRWPTANVGVRTGAVSGINVVDVDIRHLGDETIADLEKASGSLPLTVEAFTGNGSHQYYRYDEKWRTGSNILGQGLDVRSDGAYVVAPPSLHESGREYCWNVDAHPDDVTPASAPAWMRALARPGKTESTSPPPEGLFEGVMDAEKIDRDGSALVAWALKKVVAGTGRNDMGFALACQLRDAGIPRHSAWVLMRQYHRQLDAIGKFDHPYTLVELKASYEQAFSRPRREPIPGMVSQSASWSQVEMPLDQPEPAKQKPSERPLEMVLSVSDVLLKRDSVTTRYRTGIPTVDRVTRGIPAGKVISIVGKPGAGKTNLATQISFFMAVHEGCEVFALWKDEGPEASAIRIGQMLGFDRAKLEDRDPTDEAACATKVASYSYHMLDPDLPDVTVEKMFEIVDERAGDKQPVLVIDSAQVAVLSKNRPPKKQQWERINELMEFLKQETRRRGWITIICSQATRGSYRSRNEKDRDDPLSSGAGGSGIEYQSDVQLFLTGSIDEFVTIQIPKSRLGGTGVKFYVKFAKPRATFSEEGQQPEGNALDAATPRQKAQLAAVKERIVKALRSNPEISTNQLHDLVASKRATLIEALQEMRSNFDVIAEPGPRGALIWKLAVITGRPNGGGQGPRQGSGDHGGDTVSTEGVVGAGADGGAVRGGTLPSGGSQGETAVHDDRPPGGGDGPEGGVGWSWRGSGGQGNNRQDRGPGAPESGPEREEAVVRGGPSPSDRGPEADGNGTVGEAPGGERGGP